jgi:uncharacterized protein GlcG (DUF336 family)
MLQAVKSPGAPMAFVIATGKFVAMPLQPSRIVSGANPKREIVKMSSKMKILGALAALLSASVLAPSAQAQLANEKNLTLAMAQAIANGAMESCKAMGYKVSVAVIDRDGLPIVMLRGDGAGLHTPEGADRKAYTARTFRAPSAAFLKRMQNDPAAHASEEYTRVLALPGGLPIKVGEDVVGAVGVSGSPGKDDDCGQAGIDKVADQLK